MKIFKHLYIVLAGALVLFTSCDLNKAPEFNDKDAFVAFRSSTASIGEEKGTIEIPVLLSSLAGKEASVDFEFNTTTSTAVEGKNFTLANASKTLTFTKDAPYQYIKLNIIDNATFDGDVVLNITLKSPTNGLNLGDSKAITLTITDDEHPLLFILGTLNAKGTSYFNGAEEWTVTTTKDDKDLTKIWFSNFVNGGSNQKIYGVVNTAKTEVHIPVGQVIFVSPSASYPFIALEGFYGLDGDTDIPTGGYITGKIAADGTITFQDWFGSHVCSEF